jgi:hypothetical protein
MRYGGEKRKAESRKRNRRERSVFGEWRKVAQLKAFFGGFGFADGSAGVVDEVVDLIQTSEEHGMAIDDDLIELGFIDRAG